jgi:histidine ammonia-lyase
MKTRYAVALEGKALDYSTLARIGRGDVDVDVTEEAIERVRRSRDALEEALNAGLAVYGANTGVGAMRDVAFSGSDLEAFSAGLVRAHSFGTGEPFAPEVVRKAMAIRVNSALAGHTGCSETLIYGYLNLLNRFVTPLVRRTGSIGCADIGLMGQIGSVLTGVGEAFFDGRRMPAAEALSVAGLEPIRLRPKDGLAAVSSNAIGFAAACHALRRGAGATRTLMASGVSAALAMGASDAPWRAAMVVGTPLQARVAAWLVKEAEKSDIPAAKAIHDPLSLRMMAQVFAAAIGALESTARVALATTALVDDNPIVADGRILASGGSLPLDIAIALQATGLALAHLARSSFNRCVLIGNGHRRSLPVNLVAPEVVASGFGPVTKLAGELFARTLSLSPPISAQSLVVADGIEDEAAFLPLVVERFERQVAAIHRLAALESLLAAQALDLMGDRPRGVVALVHEIVRAHSAFYREDRPLSQEVEWIEGALASRSSMARLLETAPLESFDSTFSLDLGF